MSRSVSKKEKKRKSKGCAFDTVELTPGTELMYKLKDAIEYYSWSRLQNNRRYRYVEMRVSGPGVPGEGELKIIDWLNTFIAGRRPFSRSLGVDGDEPNSPSGESVMVIGSDADICLQGLATSVIQSFFVYVRNSAPKKDKKRKRFDTCISMWSLIRTLEEMFPGESNGCRLDFLLICMLNGNDYLPKIRGVGFDVLWRRYVALKGAAKTNGRKRKGRFHGQFLLDSKTRSFNWAFLSALLQKIGQAVPTLSIKYLRESKASSEMSDSASLENGEPGIESLSGNGYGDNEQKSDTEASDIGETIVYNGEDAPTGTTLDEEMEDDDEYDDNYEDEEVGVTWPVGRGGKLFDTRTWLEGVLWCIQMYVDGFTPDYGFVYAFPYAPKAGEIIQWIQVHDGDPFPIRSPVSTAKPLEPMKAAMAMLPRKYAYLLPVPFQQFFNDDSLYSSFCKDGVNVELSNMLGLFERVPPTELSPEEQRRLDFDDVVLIRYPNTSVYAANPNVRLPITPSRDFTPVKQTPVLVRRKVPSTQCAPCLSWPSGAIPELLERGYKRPFRSARNEDRRRISGVNSMNKTRQIGR